MQFIASFIKITLFIHVTINSIMSHSFLRWLTQQSFSKQLCYFPSSVNVKVWAPDWLRWPGTAARQSQLSVNFTALPIGSAGAAGRGEGGRVHLVAWSCSKSTVAVISGDDRHTSQLLAAFGQGFLSSGFLVPALPFPSLKLQFIWSVPVSLFLSRWPASNLKQICRDNECTRNVQNVVCFPPESRAPPTSG